MEQRPNTFGDIPKWVRKQTLNIHCLAPGTRLASSLSDVEIFVALFYGGILNFNPQDRFWPGRDRLIISKGHGAISLYPILADLGFFPSSEIDRVCTEGTFLGSIPDSLIPGFETINGSLGHGLGVACGVALALKHQKSNAKVFVLSGDGELFSGAVWEAAMFAGQHRLDNMVWIIDHNKICMLDYCRNIIDLSPLDEKLASFGWSVHQVDGHDCPKVCDALRRMKDEQLGWPKVLVADTVKGKGVRQLEIDSLCHIKSLNSAEVSCALGEME